MIDVQFSIRSRLLSRSVAGTLKVHVLDLPTDFFVRHGRGYQDPSTVFKFDCTKRFNWIYLFSGAAGLQKYAVQPTKKFVNRERFGWRCKTAHRIPHVLHIRSPQHSRNKPVQIQVVPQLRLNVACTVQFTYRLGRRVLISRNHHVGSFPNNITSSHQRIFQLTMLCVCLIPLPCQPFPSVELKSLS